jgi:hypothetical protein
VIPADRFLRAVDACKGDPTLRFTDTGRLVVERKPFKAFLPCQKQDLFPLTKPSTGDRFRVGDGLIEALKLLRPFIATDAERAWASTLLFDPEGNVYASTNAMIGMTRCEAFAGVGQIQLPVFAADELLRLATVPNGYPDEIATDDTGTTFFYDDAWVKTQHIAAEWPTETAQKWLEMTGKYKAIPPKLIDAIEQLLPFCPDPKFPVIHFKKDGISTAAGETEAEIAGFDLGEGFFHAENLRPMLACSTKIAILEKAALFTGPDFKGVLSLLRM